MGHSVEVPVALGEFIDKITILEIKLERFADPAMRKNVAAELGLLRPRRDVLPNAAALAELEKRLKRINEQLWDLEEAIRDCERRGDFGAHFIGLARRIYKTNDARAAVKRQINVEFGSDLIEEKSYTAPT